MTARTLAFDDVGRGTPVVLLHGFPLDRAMWDATRGLLAESCRVITPDLRGFGRSAPAPAASISDYADDVAALLDGLEIGGPLVLGGLSFGGHVAMAFVRRHPSRVHALVLACTREVGDTPEGAAERLALADRVVREGVGIVSDPMVSRLLGSRADDTMRERLAARMRRQGAEGVASALRVIASRPDSTGTLRGFAGPALVVAGEEDVISPVEVHERMRGLLCRGELVVVEGAGHLVPMEAPREFARALSGFVARVESDGSARTGGTL